MQETESATIDLSGNVNPLTPSLTTLGAPITLLAIDGRANELASANATPKHSALVGATRKCEDASSCSSSAPPGWRILGNKSTNIDDVAHPGRYVGSRADDCQLGSHATVVERAGNGNREVSPLSLPIHSDKKKPADIRAAVPDDVVDRVKIAIASEIRPEWQHLHLCRIGAVIAHSGLRCPLRGVDGKHCPLERMLLERVPRPDR